MSKKLYEAYLGDGVTASYDGWQVWLEGNADYRDNRIALEPKVLAELFAYWGRVMEAVANEAKEKEKGTE